MIGKPLQTVAKVLVVSRQEIRIVLAMGERLAEIATAIGVRVFIDG